jgi:hypothetical protein
MVNVTFNIDLSGEVFDKVFIACDYYSWSILEITESSNSVYTHTLQLEENRTYEYKFLLSRPGNSLEEWEVLNSNCVTNSPFNNRFVEVVNSDINLSTFFFSKCF